MPILRSKKGLRGSVRRSALLPLRYDLRPDRIRSQVRSMVSVVSRWDAAPTIPVTAIALRRHPEILRDLDGADVAVHGYRHVDYSTMSGDDQRRDLDAARETFRQSGLPARGFRAPYLRMGGTTLDLLRSRGFLFDSSACRLALPPDHPASKACYRMVRRRYGEVLFAPILPIVESGLVHLPVGLPDDEIIVDGLRIHNPSTLGKIFSAMLDTALGFGSCLALQVHPERFGICADPVRALLRKGIDCGAWLAPLTEIATWALKRGSKSGDWPKGHAFALSVTGDLDAVSLADFVGRFGELRTVLHGPGVGGDRP